MKKFLNKLSDHIVLISFFIWLVLWFLFVVLYVYLDLIFHFIK